MLVRAAALAIFLATTTALPAFAQAATSAEVQADIMSDEELMSATALDKLFDGFADNIASSPDTNGVAVPDEFLATWKRTAADVFRPQPMNSALSKAITSRLTPEDFVGLTTFFRSDFGKRVTALEVVIQQQSVEEQLAARDEGISMLEDLPADAPRALQVEEMMGLISADVSRAILGQSIRAMLISMALGGATGDIQVPWAEIEVQIAEIMPGLEAEVTGTQRALMAYAYRDLSDDELETYLEFLRTEPAKRFYLALGLGVGSVMETYMSQFGRDLARNLTRVNI